MSAHQPKRLDELARLLDADLLGDGSFTVRDVAHPALADGPDILALAMEEGAAAALEGTKAKAAIIRRGQDLDLGRFAGGLAADRPHLALGRLLKEFARPPHAAPGVHAQAVVEDGAEIGDAVSIGPFVYIGPGARIGDGAILMPHVSVGAAATIGTGSLLYPGARVGERCVIGRNVILHMNAAIGADGFSFVTPEPGSVESARHTGKIEAQNLEIEKINTIGNVVLGDDVEIGANSAIDSGTVAATRIGNGTKIDNLVQIGHNCRIGENCLIAGQVGIAGSAVLGDRVVLAGRVGIADHKRVGDDSIILPGSGVGQDVPEREIWGGYPAKRRDELVEDYMNISRMKRIIREVRALKADIADLRA